MDEEKQTKQKKVPLPEFHQPTGPKMVGTKESRDKTGTFYESSPGALKDAEPYKDDPQYACYLTEIFVNKYLGYVYGFDKWLKNSGCKGEIRKKLDAIKYNSKKGSKEEMMHTRIKRDKERKVALAKKRRAKLQRQLDGEI